MPDFDYDYEQDYDYEDSPAGNREWHPRSDTLTALTVTP